MSVVHAHGWCSTQISADTRSCILATYIDYTMITWYKCDPR